MFELGTVTAPSRVLLIVDPRYLDRWPLPADGDEVDLELVGADAVAVGKLYDRQWDPRFLFDVPRQFVERESEAIAALAREKGLDARVRVLPNRVTPRQRIDLALEIGRGAGEIQFRGILATVIGDLPDGPLCVMGEPMPNGHAYEDRLRRATVVVREGAVAHSEQCGHVMVDWARLLLLDVDTVDRWTNDLSLDGLGDVVFWGRDAENVAKVLSAPSLGDGTYGFRDRAFYETGALAKQIHEVCAQRDWKVAVDERPHSHLYQLMEMVRKSGTDSGIVQVGDVTGCGFMTSWGDGMFEVHRDLDRDGRLLALRIELGTEKRVALMTRLHFRWNNHAIVSRKILDEDEMVRFMYRDEPDRSGDSGWCLFSGYENDAYKEDPNNFAFVRLSELAERDKRVDALLDEPVGSVFERTPGKEEFERVTDWQPPDD